MNSYLRALFKPPAHAEQTAKPPAEAGRLKKLWRARLFSPKDFVRRALILSLLFGVAHVLGLKEFTSVLNGTTGSVALGWTMSAILGLGYVLLYLGFVLLVPTFLLAAAMLSIWQHLFSSWVP